MADMSECDLMEGNYNFCICIFVRCGQFSGKGVLDHNQIIY